MREQGTDISSKSPSLESVTIECTALLILIVEFYFIPLGNIGLLLFLTLLVCLFCLSIQFEV